MKSKAHNVNKKNNDRKDFLYSSAIIKQKIVDYIFNNIKLINYNFAVIRKKGSELLIKDNKYLILPNYEGYNYLMVFFKNKERFYSCLIDRFTLTYTPQNINLGKLNIKHIDVFFDLDIYDGTIFDGIYYYDDKNYKQYFIINDVYMFKGLNKKSDQIKNKLIEMNCFLKNNKNPNNSINISVNNNYFMFKDIETAIESYKNYNNNPDNKQKIRGIMFYPYLIDEYNENKQNQKTKLLYMFKNNIEEINNKQIINSSNDINLDTDLNNINSSNLDLSFDNYKLINNSISSNDIIFSFEVKKSNEDIYNLSLLIPKSNSLNNKVFIPKFISYAYLPTLNDSLRMRELFKNTNKLIMDCKYISVQNKTKWIPLNISSKSHPDLFNSFSSIFSL